MASWGGVPRVLAMPLTTSLCLFPVIINIDPPPPFHVRHLQVLANYISRRGPALHGLNVLELGSGTGLVGLVAGCLGARVCITDQAPLIQIMERNISLNKLQLNVTAVELDWAKPLPDLQRPDMILAADCVYFEPAFPLLVSTLAALVPLPPERAPEVLFCYKKRRKADKRFFALLKKHFTWSVVDDDPAQERYSREAISLLRLFRRTPGQLRSVSDCGRATLVR